MVTASPSNAGDVGSVPGWEAEIPHTSQPQTPNIKQKQYCNIFNKYFVGKKKYLEELTSETLPQCPPLSLKADDSFPTENGRFIN